MKLLQAADRSKDQTYFLSLVSQASAFGSTAKELTPYCNVHALSSQHYSRHCFLWVT